jgi:DNA-binding XRE family transcriptional regulator
MPGLEVAVTQGRKPNWQRRQQARQLREQGLSTAKIGKIMGVGANAVRAMIARSQGGPILKAWIRCCQCGTEIARLSVRFDTGPALCLSCLKKKKKPLFRERLIAYRLAKRLTLVELAKKIGTSPSVVGSWEHEVSSPRWEMLVKLVQVLGQGLVTEPPL